MTDQENQEQKFKTPRDPAPLAEYTDSVAWQTAHVLSRDWAARHPQARGYIVLPDKNAHNPSHNPYAWHYYRVARGRAQKSCMGVCTPKEYQHQIEERRRAEEAWKAQRERERRAKLQKQGKLGTWIEAPRRRAA
ncbi:MAG: hypothetical protein ACYTG0_33445 [Planctomycetota bacterium]|jgi:hypothetical protein